MKPRLTLTYYVGELVKMNSVYDVVDALIDWCETNSKEPNNVADALVLKEILNQLH